MSLDVELVLGAHFGKLWCAGTIYVQCSHQGGFHPAHVLVGAVVPGVMLSCCCADVWQADGGESVSRVAQPVHLRYSESDAAQYRGLR